MDENEQHQHITVQPVTPDHPVWKRVQAANLRLLADRLEAESQAEQAVWDHLSGELADIPAPAVP